MDFGRLQSLGDLADFLGFSSQNLYYLIKIGDDLYSHAEIPKKSGRGVRKLYIPAPELRGVQKQILRSILQTKPSHKNSAAYKRGSSVVDAAKKMAGPNCLLKMDIRDFFPNIGGDRVYMLFKKFGFTNKIAHILTQLTTYNNALVQGAPTSPAISNLVCLGLDDVLTKLATSWSMQYIRYSDDLFFFGDNDFKHRQFVSRVRLILNNSGFRVNRDKTKYFTSGQPRFTLGLLTHRRTVALPRVTRKKYRAAFYKASRDVSWARKNYEILSGMAEWYKAVYGKDDRFLEYSSVLKNIRSLKIHTAYLV